MSIQPIVKSTITGTSAMTLFSYLISENKEENFREPLVLADLISRLFPAMRKSDAAVEGWWLHFFSGLGFFADSILSIFLGSVSLFGFNLDGSGEMNSSAGSSLFSFCTFSKKSSKVVFLYSEDFYEFGFEVFISLLILLFQDLGSRVL